MSKITLDWNEYIEKARQASAEGIVMLKNDGALPLEKGSCTAVFGRIQNHYYKSGTGSGGLVNVSEVIGITDGLIKCGAKLNTELMETYAKWEESNPFDVGVGWGHEPWSQKEMPLEDDFVKHIAENSDSAVVIIGRTAGEEQDSSAVAGSYLLTETELDMLKKVRRHFNKMTVVLNVGGIIDMSFVKEVDPDAVLYVWQGGMVGGLGAADVLLGNVSPCGKLADTIAEKVADYPSAPYFGDNERNFYSEDIYVGYRYFETFAKDKVLYPFGFGLSYTSFEVKTVSASSDKEKIILDVNVKNTGDYSGKEVVQVYCEAPNGKLGKPARVLCAYGKTGTLAPAEEQNVHLEIKLSDLASYDDSGVTGNKSCYVLESGKYGIYVGTDVRSAALSYNFEISETTVTERLLEACAPVLPFERFVNRDGKVSMESVPTAQTDEEKRRKEKLPEEVPQTANRGIKLADVRCGKASMNEFIAQLSDDDLSCIIRGEGMGSPRVTAGTASAFGAVSDNLSNLGIPCGCCSDGPSGMRLDCGTKAFSLPNGTLLACTFNAPLMEELFTLTGREMAANNVECLLGPGMNIHRHPLNGRNFEYFSEDPYLTGTIAAAELRGMHSSGVTGTIKHYCGNNQEQNRRGIDSVISERALREIYLKGFEIAVKQGGARSVMTTYGSVNGLWTAGSYDLCTTILRDEWGFEGIVMTDWWAAINERGKAPDGTNFAAMVRAQNDLYMVCSDGSRNSSGDNTLSSLENGTLTRGELQRCAKNICAFLMNTRAMDRLNGSAEKVEIVNRPDDGDSFDAADVEFHNVRKTAVIPLDGIDTSKGASFVFALDFENAGTYRVSITASSDMGDVAQMPVTLFTMGTPSGVYTWNGTGGEWVTIEREMPFFSRFTACRLYFGQSGLTLRDIKFEHINDFEDSLCSTSTADL